jgi:hypothetical protein
LASEKSTLRSIVRNARTSETIVSSARVGFGFSTLSSKAFRIRYRLKAGKVGLSDANANAFGAVVMAVKHGNRLTSQAEFATPKC